MSEPAQKQAERKVLLITGASSGIGAATARRAIEEGYVVALAARSPEKLASLVDSLGEERALAIECDVTDAQDQQRMVAETLERYGRLDALFANAGMGARRADSVMPTPMSGNR